MPKHDLIEQDIAWCEANRNPDEKVFQDGFVAGLRHALFLMKRHPSFYSSPIEMDWSGEQEDKAWVYLQHDTAYCSCSTYIASGHQTRPVCRNCGKPLFGI